MILPRAIFSGVPLKASQYNINVPILSRDFRSGGLSAVLNPVSVKIIRPSPCVSAQNCIERTKEKVELGMGYALVVNHKNHIEATQREAAATLQRLEVL